jgi:hypothetical protein
LSHIIKEAQMSRSKKNRKKNQKKAVTKKSQPKKPAVASVAVVETPKKPEPKVHVISPELSQLCREFGAAIRGAMACALNDKVSDSRDFLLKAKAARKAANKLISEDDKKIKRTVIRKIETALVKLEREQKAKAELELIRQQELAESDARREAHLARNRARIEAKKQAKLKKAHEVIGQRFDADCTEETFLKLFRLVTLDWCSGNSLKGKETALGLVKKVKEILPNLDYSEVEELIFKSFRRAPKSENATVRYTDPRVKKLVA